MSRVRVVREAVRVAVGAGSGWRAAQAAFSGFPPLVLEQAWRGGRGIELGFAPGRVWLGWTGTALCVLAELMDADVFNPVERFNQAAFAHGDVLEIFLKPEGQDAYFEFHVTPGNRLLQLRFPSPARELPIDWEREADPLAPYKVASWRIRTRVEVGSSGWRVVALIPLGRIFEGAKAERGGRFQASFCRYDHTRGRPAPVLSSTTPHRRLDFHRQHEWLRFRLG